MNVEIGTETEYVDRSSINRSQTHECGNWDWDTDIPFLGIFCFEISVFCLCSGAMHRQHGFHWKFYRKRLSCVKLVGSLLKDKVLWTNSATMGFATMTVRVTYSCKHKCANTCYICAYPSLLARFDFRLQLEREHSCTIYTNKPGTEMIKGAGS